ncbi:MAG: hypothetical protein AAF967_01060 [Pseudomonadota bacterium]
MKLIQDATAYFHWMNNKGPYPQEVPEWIQHLVTVATFAGTMIALAVVPVLGMLYLSG